MGNSRFEEQLRALPARSGAYLFKDASGKVLYVGKASVLRNRVRSYFGAPGSLLPKIQRMISMVRDLEFIITDSEQEAVILEGNLIKQHRPHYNVRLKDDKSYPYIKVSLNEEWPRVFLTRRFEDDGARYFGPFASANSVHRTLDLLKKLFRYCSPRGVITGKKPRPCFDFYINSCVGACSGEISREDYRRIIEQVILFLEGKQDAVIRNLRAQMEEAAEATNFEKAAYLRDCLQAVNHITESQKITSTSRGDEDVIAFARENNEASVQVFFVRQGRIVGREHFMLEGVQDETPEKITASFVEQYYGSAAYVPPDILLQYSPDDREVMESWLKTRRGRRVNLVVPRRGEKKKLVELVSENAREVLEQARLKWLADSGKTGDALKELQGKLNLPVIPARIECYDISDIAGTAATGSMVVFENGRPRPSHYRRFRIRTVEGIDDYAMMREVLKRRFRRAGEANGSSWAVLPDLVIVDGGKGHLSCALEAVREST
ncbi:MAG: excinuclease ABC subunit UvrC, partial [Dehalococcoidia bacterium]|nr:excinuclease ABC subunit UvrC [Dehalococcoidia bacterium]